VNVTAVGDSVPVVVTTEEEELALFELLDVVRAEGWPDRGSLDAPAEVKRWVRTPDA
jgi:hypothetical protein